jgi:hypothetical protein
MPPILRKSLRVIPVAPGVSPIPNLTVLVFIDPPFPCPSAAREADPNLGRGELYAGVCGLRMNLAALENGRRVPKEVLF